MAHGSDGDGNLAKLIKTTHLLEKTLECPVCLEVVKPPVKHCIKGHVICSRCVDKMADKICPLCSQVFSTVETSTFVNNLLEARPRLCKYSEAGCKEVCVPGEDDEHEDFCGFRPMTCKLCLEKIPVNSMFQHYEEKRRHLGVHMKNPGHLVYTDVNPYKRFIYGTYMFIDDHVFSLKLENDANEKNLKITCFAYYTSKPRNKYYVSVKFENDPCIVQMMIQAINMTAEFGSDEEGLSYISESDENIKEFCMYVPQSLVSHFVTKDKTLKLSYNIFCFEVQTSFS